MAAEQETLCVLDVFQQIKIKMGRLLEPLAQEEGLTPLQGLVLLQVSRGETTVGDISQQAHMGRANASTLCKKMEQAGYLTRKRSQRDERVVILELTAQGAETLERMQKKLARFEVLLEQMPAQIKKNIIQGLNAANQALDYFTEQTKGDQAQC